MLYYNINELLEKGQVFSFIIGPRGLGKAEAEAKVNAVDIEVKGQASKTLP